MKVGLLTHGFVGWGGGMDFLRLVASSLHATGEPIEFHALLPMKGPLYSARQTLRRLRAVLRPTPPAPDRAAIIDAIESFDVPLTVHEIDRGSRALQASYRRLQLDVMLPALDALSVSPEIPWVGYLYDFQHRHLPQLFNARDIAERDRAFRKVLQAAPAIVVNSRTVAADAEKFVPEARGKLFQKFARVRTEDHLKVSGTGLGLYISRLIVEGHGGQIWVESEFGKGSTFGLALPLDARSAQRPAPAADRVDPTPTPAVSRSPVRAPQG